MTPVWSRRRFLSAVLAGGTCGCVGPDRPRRPVTPAPVPTTADSGRRLDGVDLAVRNESPYRRSVVLAAPATELDSSNGP
ncbi:hypothetical protein ACFQL1_21890 [Halomicroarcula sp. GCM10025709]|uniref:hypothetical protein n=1 Tax=Halomicroarcula sp. GCM10025709 TaxID=3252669 RepID=UPI00360B7B69